LIQVVLNGLEGPIEVKGQSYNNAMPPHRFLQNEDVARVLTYIRQSFGNKASTIHPEEVAKVRRSLKERTDALTEK
jgi:mono/diheme cytochrome c family protein